MNEYSEYHSTQAKSWPVTSTALLSSAVLYVCSLHMRNALSLVKSSLFFDPKESLFYLLLRLPEEKTPICDSFFICIIQILALFSG